MSDTSRNKQLAESCMDRVRPVYCPHRQQRTEVTASRWQLSDGRWTAWAVMDCPLLRAGLVDCDMSCLAAADEPEVHVA